MADEDVIAEQGEQEPVEAVQVDAVDQPEAQAVEQGVAAGDGAVSDESSVPAAVETLAEPDTLEAFLARNEAARAEHEQTLRERENAGAQRREAQLKRDAGKKEITRANVERFLAVRGVDVDDPRELDYFWELAQANAALALVTDLPKAVIKGVELPADVITAAAEKQAEGDWDGYVSTLLNGMTAAVEAPLRAAIRKDLDAENAKWREAELKAMRAELAPKREGAPTIPGTGAAGSGITQAQLDAMPTEVFLAKPLDEQRRLTEQARQNSQRLAGVAR